MSDDKKEMIWERILQNYFPSEYLESAPKSIKNDKDYVIEAIQRHYDNFYFASKKLKDDKEVVMLAVKMNGENIEYASERLKNDKEVLLMAVRTRGGENFILQKYLEDEDIKKAIAEREERRKNY